MSSRDKVGPNNELRPNRRQVLGGGGALSLGLSLGLGSLASSSLLTGCQAPEEATPHHLRQELVPSQETIYSWIKEVFDQGVRRPGYPADQWTEQFCLEQFERLGLEDVRLEPAPLDLWEPRAWSLRAASEGEELSIPCFPLPHSAPTPGLEAELVRFDPKAPEAVGGKVALEEVRLMRFPANFPVAGLGDIAEDWQDLAIQLKPEGRVYDPRGTLENAVQILPFGPRLHDVMERSMEAGAVGFIGCLSDFPGSASAGSADYYVPYDGRARPIPGVWIDRAGLAALHSLLDKGPVTVSLEVDSRRERVTSHNVVGELAGLDEEQVVIGSHHDGPWASAVEDASGVALVLAQAAYWSATPKEERPHRLTFLITAGHMVGGAGCRSFIEQHADELDRIVLEVHLEHTALELVEGESGLVPSGLPEPRWWFTSRIAPLEEAVFRAIETEGLDRSLLIPPDVFGPAPTTDGAAFHLSGVPIVNFLTAPFYLFDSMDTLDKIDVEGLVPVTRAAIRIVHSTHGMTAAAMRQARRG